MNWFREGLYPAIQQAFAIEEELYEGRTAFQSVRIFRNPVLGRVMTLDGVVQTTESDEFFYHEMMTHLPIIAHGAAKTVLIVGGGDGGCLREALRHGLEKATMVEIDGEVVELSKQYLPSICGKAFEDPRTELIIGDGAKYMAETSERFDVIIVDSTDPIGPGEVLFREAFYANCRRCLTERGILVTQNGVPFFQPDEFKTTGEARRKLFPHSGYYFVAVPTYYGGDMALGWASTGTDMANADPQAIADRVAAAGLETRYYNPQIHQAAFARPEYLRQLLP